MVIVGNYYQIYEEGTLMPRTRINEKLDRSIGPSKCHG